MSITRLQAQRIDRSTWLVFWTGTVAGATYYVYRDGKLAQTTRGTSARITAGAAESPHIEVFDDANARPSDFYPRRATLTWYASPGADYYRVEERTATGPDVWTLRERVPDRAPGYFKWESRVLEDGQTHRFRVVPFGRNGNLGTLAELVVLMVRRPDVPAATFSYSEATGNVTITA